MRDTTLRRRQVYGLLRTSIVEGSHPPGAAFPTERELAHNYGLTRAMARTIIRQLEKDSLVERLANGRPVVAAQGWRLKSAFARTGAMPISVWPGAPGAALANILLGVHRAAGELGVTVTLGPWVDGDWEARLEAERQFLHQAAEDSSLAGVILWYLGFGQNDEGLRKLVERGKRIVFIDRDPPPGLQADCVMSDSFGGARTAVTRLIQGGHKQIALFATADRASSVTQRVAGYRAALKRAQIMTDPELEVEIISSASKSAEKAVEEGLDRVLSQSHPATAIFAVHDLLASYIVGALGSRGLSIPQDVAVVGFDGLARWDRSLPDLAGPSQQFAEIGERAVEILWSRATGELTGPPRTVLLEAPFRHGSTFPTLPMGGAALGA